MTRQEELAELRRKLAARTDRDGKPKAGYAPNVEALKARIAVLEIEGENA